MFKKWMTLAAVLGGLWWTLGNKAPHSVAAQDSHFDEPIIIDNPQAFVGLLTDLTEMEYVVGPLVNGSKTIAGVLGRTNKITHIRHSASGGGNVGGPVALDPAAAVRIVFSNKAAGGQPVTAGEMSLKWEADYDWGPLGRSHSVVVNSVDQGTGDQALRWTRHNQVAAGKERMGLYHKNSGHLYEVAKLIYKQSNATQDTTVAFNTGGKPVRIRLCTAADAVRCPAQ